MLSRVLAIARLRGDHSPVRKLIGILFLALALPVRAGPLHDPDNGALSGMFHFPDSSEGALLTPLHRHAFSVVAIASSHSTLDASGGEELVLDGETTRLFLDYRYGVTDRLEIGIRLPYVWHESGSLDSFVKNWHNALGLPLGSRGARADDQIEFSYSDDGSTLFDYQRHSNGPGDVRVLAGWQLTNRPNYVSALRFGLKLPTGDAGDFHGSGGTDASIGIAGDWTQLFGSDALSGFYRAHLNVIGEPDVLADRYENLVGQVSVGAGYRLSHSVDLRVQASGRTANYESDTEILGRSSAWITFGARFGLSSSYSLDIAVAEDLLIRSAPDVSFLVSLRRRPGRD